MTSTRFTSNRCASPASAPVAGALPRSGRVVPDALTRRRFAQLLGALLAGTGLAGARALPAWASEGGADSAAADVPGAAWINSDVYGAVSPDADIDLRDDFNASQMREWVGTVDLSSSVQVSTFTQRSDEVTAQIVDLILDEEGQTGHEAQLVRRLYADFLDMDARNALGVEPLAASLEEIRAIETLDDLTAYLLAGDDHFASGPLSITVSPDTKDSTHNAVWLNCHSLALSDAGAYEQPTEMSELTRGALGTLLHASLGRVGYAEQDIDAIVDGLFDIETQIAAGCLSNAEAYALPSLPDYIYNPYTIDELREASPAFPIVGMLQQYVDAGVDRVIVYEPTWLEHLNEIYTQDNVEGFKALLTLQTIQGTSLLLDQQAYDDVMTYQATVTGTQASAFPIELLAFTYVSTMLGMAMGKMYAEAYVSAETKAAVTDIIDEAIAVFRERLQANEWLSEQTRERAIEKLDALKVRVGAPDDWSLYGYDEFDFPEESGIYADTIALTKRGLAEKVRLAVSPIDANVWPINPQDVNANNYLVDNSINVAAGILGGDFFDPQGSRASQMGAIGTIIGHEITHGFDDSGSQYDADGNVANWWTDEDRATFETRTQAVDAYYTAIEVLPDQYIQPAKTVGETVADLGGMSCMLQIARGIEGFDYEEFFESYARVWRCQQTEGTSAYMLQSDVHAPGYLRTNVTVQQFEEFYETFGVVEGDGMWLAPERRLSVW